MRTYLRYSPSTFMDKAVDDGYPPGAFAAFCAVLCLAEEQPERGRFRSERLLRLLLDEPKEGHEIKWGKWVPYLIEHGDLVRQAGGILYLAGWDEWQEGDVTVKERMQRLRSKKRDVADRNGQADGVTEPTVTVPSEPSAVGGKPSAVGNGNARPTEESNRYGLPHVTAAVAEVGERITGHGLLSAGDRQSTELDRLVQDHGEQAVIAAMRRFAGDRRVSWRQLVWDGLVKSLEPFGQTPRTETAAERDDRELAQIRAQAQQNLAAQGATR